MTKTEPQKEAIKIALSFCRKRLTLSAKGPLDYDQAAEQINALEDVKTIRELVSWVLDYNSFDQSEKKSTPPPGKRLRAAPP